MSSPVKKTTTTTVTRWTSNPNVGPLYPRCHTKYLSTETLRYYNLPWEYDRHDRNYIIVKREMTKYETDVLFEHSRRIRERTLLLEPAKKEKQYAFYRKRARSSSRIRKAGILEL